MSFCRTAGVNPTQQGTNAATTQLQPDSTQATNNRMSSILFASTDQAESSLSVWVSENEPIECQKLTFQLVQIIVLIIVGVVCFCCIVVAILICFIFRLLGSKPTDATIDGNPMYKKNKLDYSNVPAYKTNNASGCKKMGFWYKKKFIFFVALISDDAPPAPGHLYNGSTLSGCKIEILKFNS